MGTIIADKRKNVWQTTRIFIADHRGINNGPQGHLKLIKGNLWQTTGIFIADPMGIYSRRLKNL